MEGFYGVALWLPSGTLADEASLARVIEDTMAEELFEQMDPYHPDEPHWHLPLIGVNPVS